MPPKGEALDATAVDERMSAWRQGDCVVGEQWFVSRVPLDDEGDLLEERVAGFAVLSQTCDIVRGSESRPYLEVAALVEVEDDELHDISRARTPRFAFIPAMAEHKLVVDLDRVMCVEKRVAASWIRAPGWTNDEEVRQFQFAIARKRVRFAFPDDFNRLCSKLVSRLKKKHDKQSGEGAALRALQEIRVAASPSWEAEQVELLFWFVRDEAEPDHQGVAWSNWLERWLELVVPTGRFFSVDGAVVTLEDMSARDYVDSDRLDLDQLSLP